MCCACFCVSASQLRNGNIQYISDAGAVGKVERTIGDAPLSDGQWHTLQLVRNGSATLLRVDATHSRVIQHTTQDFGGLGVLTLSLGGIPPGPAQQKTAAGESGNRNITSGFTSVSFLPIINAAKEPLTSEWSQRDRQTAALGFQSGVANVCGESAPCSL